MSRSRVNSKFELRLGEGSSLTAFGVCLDLTAKLPSCLALEVGRFLREEAFGLEGVGVGSCEGEGAGKEGEGSEAYYFQRSQGFAKLCWRWRGAGRRRLTSKIKLDLKAKPKA